MRASPTMGPTTTPAIQAFDVEGRELSGEPVADAGVC